MLTETVRHFIENGIDYYVAARFAARAQLMPVCGNIYHHAVEMLLKGHLAQTLSLQEIERFRHNLPQLLNSYKATLPAATLAQFDPLISQLQAFEEFRYPDDIIEHGAQIVLMWEAPPDGLADIPSSEPPPAYKLVVKDLDRLIAAVVGNGPMNPKFLASRLKPHALPAVTHDNPATSSGGWLSSE